jgi:hypothetical protein
MWFITRWVRKNVWEMLLNTVMCVTYRMRKSLSATCHQLWMDQKPSWMQTSTCSLNLALRLHQHWPHQAHPPLHLAHPSRRAGQRAHPCLRSPPHLRTNRTGTESLWDMQVRIQMTHALQLCGIWMVNQSINSTVLILVAHATAVIPSRWLETEVSTVSCRLYISVRNQSVTRVGLCTAIEVCSVRFCTFLYMYCRCSSDEGKFMLQLTFYRKSEITFFCIVLNVCHIKICFNLKLPILIMFVVYGVYRFLYKYLILRKLSKLDLIFM